MLFCLLAEKRLDLLPTAVCETTRCFPTKAGMKLTPATPPSFCSVAPCDLLWHATLILRAKIYGMKYFSVWRLSQGLVCDRGRLVKKGELVGWRWW